MMAEAVNPNTPMYPETAGLIFLLNIPNNKNTASGINGINMV